MNKKIEELRNWGCDVDEAMKRMLDDDEFYLECLNSIPEDEYFARLKEALVANEVNEAFDCAHTLKGVFINLGLTPMYNKTVEIVEPLRIGNSDNLLNKLDELLAMKDKLCNILN